jgi:hypothetical protein
MRAGTNPFVHGSVMFRRTAYTSLRDGYRINANAEDFDLWLRLASQGNLGIIEEQLYAYYFTSTGLTFSKFDLLPRLKALLLRLDAERLVGDEISDWRAEIDELKSSYETASLGNELREANAEYARALRALRGRRYGEYFQALRKASNGVCPRAKKARILLAARPVTPLLRRILLWRLAKNGDRFARPLPAQSPMPSWIVSE